MREVAQHVGIGGIGPVVVGSPEKVADEIEEWFDETDVDGLNVPFAVSPGDFEDITDMLVPELVQTRALQGSLPARAPCAKNCSAKAARVSPRRIRCFAGNGLHRSADNAGPELDRLFRRLVLPRAGIDGCELRFYGYKSEGPGRA